ncbi:YbdK family carboxylate-amine ligase [Botrimarina sp.]|uniref:carboxylate-amine ligase n=1 Tax=Botrimarina sp. TaxID=2795802 RepID=UPI0032ED8F70
MAKIGFTSNSRPTLGVEIELGLVDERTMALANAFDDLAAELGDDAAGVKHELMQCVLEINTGVCESVDEAEADLEAKLRRVERAADVVGLRLWWGASHPFSLWRDQRVTVDERYLGLVNLLQEMARRLITFGLHVHVGVDSGDKAVMICDRIMRHLPTLLAMSTSSPFWEGRRTGLQSYRSKVMEGLPTAGLPTLMRNWSEYVWLVNHMVGTGFINTIREIWWDVRPHHNFGTVEVRVCDMPGNLEHTLALAALIQCLVRHLSDEIDNGAYQHDCHPMMVRQNKWRAARFGVEADLVDQSTHETKPARAIVSQLTEVLSPTARKLGCEHWLAKGESLTRGTGWSQRQLDLHDQHGDLASVVRQLTSESRISAAAKGGNAV